MSLFGSGEYKVYRWDSVATPGAGTSQFVYPTSLSAGDAFWIKSYAGAMPYSYSGGVVDTTQDYTISLMTGWNQVGTPFQRDYPWGMAQMRWRQRI